MGIGDMDECQRDVHVKQKCRYADDAQDRNHPLFQSINHHAFDGIHVFDHAREQVARGALIKITDGQALEFRIHPATHVEDDILFELVVDEHAQAAEAIAQEKRAEQSDHRRSEKVAA
jgi:hypothetical protein